MYRLTREEKGKVVTNCDHLYNLRFSKMLPYAFTEYGALMAANVLNSERAVGMSVLVVRAIGRLREAAPQYEELARRLYEVERRVAQHDVHLAGIVRKLRELAQPPEPRRLPRIGFAAPQDKEK